MHTTISDPLWWVVVIMVFDIGDLHVKGREWKVGKRRSRGLLLKNGIGRGGKREGRRGRRKGGEQPALKNKKIVPAPLASKHLFGRSVKMLQTSWPPMGFAIRQMQSSRKFQSQDQSYQCQGQVAKESSKAFAFKTKVTFHNMPRSKACKRFLKSFILPWQVQRLEMSVVHDVDRVLH